MKSLMMLWSETAKEFGCLCSVSTTRDLETVTSRVKDEGLSFLTITLPSFCSDLQKGLAEGQVTPDMFMGFARHAGLPRFLGGFLELIFDRASGVLVSDPSIEAIQAVRQLTLMYGKLELPASERRVRAAIRSFVDTEASVKRYDTHRTSSQTFEFQRVSRLLWSEVLQRVDNDLYAERANQGGFSDPNWPYVIPKHGPGATADRLSGNRKYDLREWSQRLEDVFPFGEYGIPSWRHVHRLARVDTREPGTERPVRVVTVPKTLKTPRIIAIEPSYMQYMQQGVKDMIVDSIRHDSSMGKVVGFDDQWRNRHLAFKGSLTGSLATLDLSEASDRVSNQLVRAMLQPWPHVSEAVDATRSRKADVPGHGVIRLAKFASMGSALTFPIEAMVFATVVFIGIEKGLGHQLTRSAIQRIRGQVRVYGDDIIVPVEFADSVVESLEAYGFKVNSNKSFLRGLFRESCGREYYAGHDVSVVRVRQVVRSGNEVDFPSSRRYVRETESTVALRNRFYLSGLWRTAAWLDRWIEPLLGGYYPTIEVTQRVPWEEPTARSSMLSRWSIMPWRPHLEDHLASSIAFQRPIVKGWNVKTPIPSSKVSGEGALLKVLNPRRVKPFDDPLHLERAGRSDAGSLKLRWNLI